MARHGRRRRAARALAAWHRGRPAAEVRGGAARTASVVAGIDPDGAAAQKGLRQGDVILEVGGKSVSRVRPRSRRARPAPQGRHEVRPDAGEDRRRLALRGLAVTRAALSHELPARGTPAPRVAGPTRRTAARRPPLCLPRPCGRSAPLRRPAVCYESRYMKRCAF